MSKTYHFIGIGGIGMSAIAKILLSKNIKVKGSDLKYNSSIKELEKNGAKIQIGHNSEFVEKGDIVVISSAIKKDNPEYKKAIENKLNIIHRSDLLEELLSDRKSILITGTHGKTTTTSLISSVFLQNKSDPSFVIGGILNAKKTNGYSGSGDYFIAEADESDGSFLKSKAHSAIVTNLEEEHLSYWKNFKNLEKGFIKFFSNVENKKNLFWCKDDKNLNKLSPEGVSYGFSNEADLVIENVVFEDFQSIFDIKFKDKIFKKIRLNLLGKHNVLNAAAAFGLCINLNVDEKVIRKAFELFKGVSRRLEKIGEAHKTIFFDDYAHHPTEVLQTLKSLREGIKEKRLVCIFQPHRYSRLRDFLEAFSSSFDEVDELIISNVYTAGEDPIKNVNERILLEKIAKRDIDVKYIKDEHIDTYLLHSLKPFDVVIALGAGDISSKLRNFFFNFSKKKIKKINVGIIYGGKSSEHDISIRSAKNYVNCFDKSLYNLNFFKISKEGKWSFEKEVSSKERINEKVISKEIIDKLLDLDVAFPILHGPFGEDGSLYSFLETLNISCIGCDKIGAAISMDKAVSKYIAIANDIKTAAFLDISLFEWKKDRKKILKQIDKKFDLPIYIKPNHLGSSIAVKFAQNKKDVEKFIDYVFKFDNSLIIEENIKGKEIQTSVIGNDYIIIGEIGEILTDGKFFDFENKYLKSDVKAKISIDISSKKNKEIKLLSEKIFKIFRLSGFARIDFFINEEGEIYFNEINPIPGFTSDSSLFPKMLEYIGISNQNMIDTFVILAMHANRKNKKLAKIEL